MSKGIECVHFRISAPLAEMEFGSFQNDEREVIKYRF